jgi:protein-histidine N-methyltransferase
MSFSFGFTSESFTDDELQDAAPSTQQQPTTSSAPLNNATAAADDAAPFPPQIHHLESLLQSLTNTRLTFETISTPGGETLYRRELFDVKHQLMSEDTNMNASSNESTNDVLLGLGSSSDLLRNVYEGGFKSWECSTDLVDRFAHDLQQDNNSILITGDLLELGCGTALPSCFLFKRLLSQSQQQQQQIRSQSLVLTDYNASVLRLVTLPNLILTWAQSVLTEEELAALQKADDETIPIVSDELQLSPSLLARFASDLQRLNLALHFISGSWSPHFLSLLSSISQGFETVYTSETIYSLETLPVISDLLIELKAKNTYVAAKDIYFGVGGNLVDFLNYLERRNREGALQMAVDVAKVGGGLQRSIVLITW